jgi:hypothetical protein
MAKGNWIRKLRNTFLRFLLYLGLPAVLILAFVHTPLVKSLVFDALNRYVQKKYDLQLSVRTWDYSLLTGQAMARDLNLTTAQGAFFCRVPAVDFQFSTRELLTGEWMPESLQLDGVQIVLNLPSEELRWHSRDSSPAVDIHFRKIAVRNGTLRVRDVEVPLDFDAGRIDWALTRTGEEPTYQVDLSLRDAIIRQGSRVFRLDRADLNGDWAPSQIRFLTMFLDSPLLTWQGSGGVATTGSGRYHFTGRGRIQLAQLKSIQPDLPVELAGEIGVNLLLAGEGGSPPILSGSLQSRELFVNRQRIRGFSARLAMSGEDYACDDLHLEVDPDGVIFGRVVISPGGRKVVFSAQLMDLALELFRTGKFLQHPIEGLVEGRVEGEIPFSGPPTVRWQGQIADLGVLLPNGRDYYRGALITGRVELDQGTIRFSVDQALGEGVILDADGRFAKKELWIDHLHVLVPTHEEARELIERVARLSPRLTEKLHDLTINGRTEFSGKLHLKGSFPDITGTLEAEHVALGGVGWDSLRLPFDLNRDRLLLRQAALRQGSSHIDLDLDLRLEPDTHLDFFDATVQDLAWKKVERTLNYLSLGFGDTHPERFFSADLSGRIHLRMKAGEPWEGYWNADADRLSHRGQTLGRLSVEGHLFDRQVRLEKVVLRGENIDLSGHGAWDSGSNKIEGAAEIRQLGLERVNEARDAGLEGILSGTLQVQGTLDNPDLLVDLSSSRLVFQGEPFGDLQMKGRLQEQSLAFNLRTVYRRNLYHTLGTLSLGDQPKLETTLLLDGVRIRPFLRQFKSPLYRQLEGSLTGEIIVTYPFEHPEKMEVDARIQKMSLTYRHLQLDSRQTIYLKVANRRLSLDGATLALNGDPVTVQGNLDLFPLSRLQVDLQGTLQADLLAPFWPDFHPAGQLVFRGSVQGDPANPSIFGRVELKDASVKIRSPELALRKINGVLELSSRSIRAERMTLDTPYGPAVLSGDCLLKNLQASRWSVGLTSERLYLPYPKGFLSQVSLALRLQGQRDEGSLLSGDVWIDKAAPASDVDLAGFVMLLSDLGVDNE